MNVRGLKIVVTLLSLALLGALLAAGGVDARRQRDAERRANVALEAAINPQIARGRAVFEKYSCNACHGRDGAGGIMNINAETGGRVNDLTHTFETYTVQEVTERIQNGVPEVGKNDPTGPDPPLRMPSYRNLIGGQELRDLVTFVASLRPAPGSQPDSSAW